MSVEVPFCPHYGQHQLLTAGAASLFIPISGNNEQVRIVNPGVNVAYVKVASTPVSGSVTATTADFPVWPGQASIITKQIGDSGVGMQLAYISALGTTLSVIPGNGN